VIAIASCTRATSAGLFTARSRRKSGEAARSGAGIGVHEPPGEPQIPRLDVDGGPLVLVRIKNTRSLSTIRPCNAAGRSESQRIVAMPEMAVARSLESFSPSHVARCSFGWRMKSISRWEGSLAFGASASALSSCSMPASQKRSLAGWSRRAVACRRERVGGMHDRQRLGRQAAP